MGRITNLLIGLSIIGFIFSGFVFYMSDSSNNTGLVSFDDTKYNNTYNKLNEINTLSNDIKNEGNKSVEQSTTDILGSYFKQGYSAFRLTLSSLSLTTTMVNDASNELQIDDGSNNFFLMLTTIITIIIVFGVIIYVVVGKDV